MAVNRKMRFGLIFSLLPVMVVIIGLFAGGVLMAIGQSLGYFSPTGESGPTLRHYLAIAIDREFWNSLRVTLLLGGLATFLAAAGGMLLALALRRLAERQRLFGLLIQIPLAVPHLSTAIVLIYLFSPSGLAARVLHWIGLIATPADFPLLINDRAGIGIVLAYLLKELPFVTIMVLTLLSRIGEDLEEVARTLGATAWQRFRYVTLPMIAPAALSSSLLVFAFIIGAFETPYLLGRTYPATLSVVAQRRYMDPDLTMRPGAIAMAVLLSVLTTGLVWLYLKLAQRWSGIERPLFF